MCFTGFIWKTFKPFKQVKIHSKPRAHTKLGELGGGGFTKENKKLKPLLVPDIGKMERGVFK